MEEETKNVHMSVSLMERLALSCVSNLCLVNTLAREILDEGDHAEDARGKIDDMIQKGTEACGTFFGIVEAISKGKYKKTVVNVSTEDDDDVSVEEACAEE